MTLTQVNEILNGTFENNEDRIYWEVKKAELIAKAKAMNNNEAYYKKMAVYDR